MADEKQRRTLPRSRGCTAVAFSHTLSLLLLVLLVGACAVCVQGAPAVDCQALGFTGLALCSDCDALAQHVKDPELEADCRKCCTAEDEAVQGQSFASAILEVCMRRVGFYPAVGAFIQEHAARHPQLAVRYRAHTSPRLLMKDEDGQVQDTVMIDSWRTEQIDEFLRKKLRADEEHSA